MSIKVTSRAWDTSNQSGSDLLVLLALADHADDDGVCWPGLERVGKKARIEVRQAKRAVKKLAADGELYIEQQHGQRGGRGYTNLYLITIGLSAQEIISVLIRRFEKPISQAQEEAGEMVRLQKEAKERREAGKKRKGVSGDTHNSRKGVSGDTHKKGVIQGKKGVIQGKKGVIAMTPEPSIKPSIESSGGESLLRENRIIQNPEPGPPPAIRIYTEMTGITPARALWKRAADSVGEDETNLKRWKETIAGWLGTGWKAGNIIGMLEYYGRGEIPSTGNGRKPNDEGSRYKKPKITDEIKEAYNRLASKAGGFNPT